MYNELIKLGAKNSDMLKKINELEEEIGSLKKTLDCRNFCLSEHEAQNTFLLKKVEMLTKHLSNFTQGSHNLNIMIEKHRSVHEKSSLGYSANENHKTNHFLKPHTHKHFLNACYFCNHHAKRYETCMDTQNTYYIYLC